MKIFVSYAHVDTYNVKSQIVELLQTAGHDVWFDQKLLPGQDWKNELFNAIQSSDTFLYALTSDSIESEWCRWELDVATNAGKKFIPVLLRKTSLPDELNSVQYVDFTEGPTPNAVARLLGGLQTLPSNYIAKSISNPKGLPAQAIDSVERLTRTSRLLPLFDIAFYGLSLNFVVPFDSSHSQVDAPVLLTDLAQYKSEFINQLNTVKICSKQVFEKDEYEKLSKIFLDIEDVVANRSEHRFTDALLYMVDRAEHLIRALQSTLSGKSLASFTAGAIMADWTLPVHDEENVRTYIDPGKFLQVVQALTSDSETIDHLRQLSISTLTKAYPQTSQDFRDLLFILRHILIQNDVHLL